MKPGKELSETNQSFHPGVTTMWLGGISLWLKYQKALSALPVYLPKLEGQFDLLSPSTLAQSRLPITLITAFTTVCVYFLLRKLLGTSVATLATIFIAADLFYLWQSRCLHTDALMTSFLLFSLLSFLLYLEFRPQRRYIAFSGLCSGLACLSKSPSIIFILFLPFLLLDNPKELGQPFVTSTVLQKRCQKVLVFLAWSGTAFLTFIGLWPAIWVAKFEIGGVVFPVFGFSLLVLTGATFWSYHILKNRDRLNLRKSVWSICGLILIIILSIALICQSVSHFFTRIVWGLTTAHEVPHFFLGKMIDDPGWLFYPLMTSIRGAPLTLPLAIVGLGILWSDHLRHHLTSQRTLLFRICSASWILVLLFIFCLSLGAKKSSRYILPVFPILDLLAAIGLYLIVENLKRVRRTPILRTLNYEKNRFLASVGGWVVLIGVLAIQLIPVFSVYPYYGTYYNPLWRTVDITKVCTIGDGAGSNLAAHYLNQKPDAKSIEVLVSPLSLQFFERYFLGRSFKLDSNPQGLIPDYEVVHLLDTQVSQVPKTGQLDGILEHVIRLNGVDYVWIYKVSN